MSIKGIIGSTAELIIKIVVLPESSKGYLLVSSANFRFTKEQASVIISIFFSLGRCLPPRMLMQSRSTVSTLLKVLKEEKGSWKMA